MRWKSWFAYPVTWWRLLGPHTDVPDSHARYFTYLFAPFEFLSTIFLLHQFLRIILKLYAVVFPWTLWTIFLVFFTIRCFWGLKNALDAIDKIFGGQIFGFRGFCKSGTRFIAVANGTRIQQHVRLVVEVVVHEARIVIKLIELWHPFWPTSNWDTWHPIERYSIDITLVGRGKRNIQVGSSCLL